MYYIAYGSNLNKEEMKQRCKDAKFVSLARLETIHLHIVEILDELILQ